MHRNGYIGVFFSASLSSTPQQLTWLLGVARVELGGPKGPNVSDIVFLLPKGTYQGGWEGGGWESDSGTFALPLCPK